MLELRREIGIARGRSERGRGLGRLGRADPREILDARVAVAQRLDHAAGEVVHARAKVAR